MLFKNLSLKVGMTFCIAALMALTVAMAGWALYYFHDLLALGSGDKVLSTLQAQQSTFNIVLTAVLVLAVVDMVRGGADLPAIVSGAPSETRARELLSRA